MLIPALLVLLVAYTLHPRDVFQPPPPPPLAGWSQPAPGRETRQLTLPDATIVRGWLYPAALPNSPTVLFFYGSNEDLAHEANRLAWLRDTLHVNALCFDLPGYGFSPTSSALPSLPAIHSAALLAFDAARQLSPSAPVVVYGWSIGTSLALHVAAHRPVAGLILQAPPATADAMLLQSSHHDVPWYGRGLVHISADPDVRDLYEGVQHIRTLHTPLLLLHGTQDDVVPIAQGRQVFAASPSTTKQFVEVPNAGHNNLRISQPPASTALTTFLQSLTPPSPASAPPTHRP